MALLVGSASAPKVARRSASVAAAVIYNLSNT
jgi:hypothetical protein